MSASFRWQSMKSMPTKRVFASAIIHNNSIYVVGGCDEKGKPLDSFEVYEDSKWSKLPSMPTKRAGPGVVAINERIIVVGGVSEEQNPLDVVEVYNIKNKTWKKEESMMEALMGMSVFVKDGKVYMVGGMGSCTNPKDYFFELDVESSPIKWSRLSPIPTPRYASSSFLIANDLYIVGGRQGKIPTTAFEVYHFDTKKWESLPPLPSKRVFPMYLTDNTNIYSIGGLRQPPTDGFADVCEVYNLKNKSWKDGSPMPTKRGDMAAGVVGGKVIVAGGLGNSGKPMNIVEAYDPVSDTWSEICNLPSAHCSCTSIVLKERLHVIGGLSLRGPSACMEALSLAQKSD